MFPMPNRCYAYRGSSGIVRPLLAVLEFSELSQMETGLRTKRALSKEVRLPRFKLKTTAVFLGFIYL